MNKPNERLTIKTGLTKFLLAAIALATLTGCLEKVPRIKAAAWDPSDAADRAISQFDQDGDGQLSAEELEAAPGLKYCAKDLDTNGNGTLSWQEVYDRIELYRELNVALTSFSCQVRYKGRPLPNATVRLVPETFLSGVAKPSTGTTTRQGHVQLKAEGEDVPAAAIGMFRVEITSTDVKILAKYNTATTLGVEVSPVTNLHQTGPIIFDLKD